MRDLTRYEKELAKELKNLPLPGEDASWEEMSKLLDENNDKLPPPYRKYIVLGSLAILLIGSLLFYINNKKATDKQLYNQTINTKATGGNKDNNSILVNTNSTMGNNITAENANNSTTGIKSINSIVKASDINDSKNNNIEKTTNNKKKEKIKNINITNNSTVKHSILISRESSITNEKTNHNNTIPFTKNEVKDNTINNKKATDKNTLAKKKNIQNKTAEANADKDNLTTNNTTSSQYENSISKDADLSSTESRSTKHTLHHNSITTRSNTKTPSQKNGAISDNDATLTVPANTNSKSENNTAKKNNMVASKAHVKRSVQNKNTINNSSAIANDTETTSTTSENNTVKASNSNAKQNHTVVPYYHNSTAAISAKHNKKSFHNKKNSSSVSTKIKMHINIINSNIDESDNSIDTTELIKIGQYVIANKKAKHHIIKKDTNAIKPLVFTAKDSRTTAKKKDDNKKQLHISVGIAEQQAARLTCDCVYPNDAYTKSSLITDYIPSVYIRIQPSKKWFIQAELKYKAPQYLQEQLYKNSVQNLPLNYTTTSSVLKKIYYNQIPLSFDYYIVPHLSLGVGVIFNNFAGAVSQHDTRKKLYGTAADSTISSSIITNNGDSGMIFTKNSFQGLIESQYDWKRFSFGARYAIGLQTYLKYNDPTSGNLIEKKNDALTIFIRYELWDPRGKKKK